MKNLLPSHSLYRSLFFRHRRTHGGFGIVTEPRIGRSHAVLGALAVAGMTLGMAGAQSVTILIQERTFASVEAGEMAADEEMAQAAMAGENLPRQPDVAAAGSLSPATLPTAPENAEQAPAAQTASEIVDARFPDGPAPTSADGRAELAAMMSGNGDGTQALLDSTSGVANAFQEVDAAHTAAIAGRAAVSNVHVAETEEEIAALEEELTDSEATEIAQLDEEPADQMFTENGNAFNAPSLADARATQYVNLRAGPSDEAEVLTVVPANAQIRAATDCNWCEVVYEDQRGFIYKNFIRHGGT